MERERERSPAKQRQPPAYVQTYARSSSGTSSGTSAPGGTSQSGSATLPPQQVSEIWKSRKHATDLHRLLLSRPFLSSLRFKCK